MFCFSLLFVYLFLMIPVRPIISKIVEIYRTDIRQIIGIGRTLVVDDKSDFLISRVTLPWQPLFVDFIHRTDFRHASGWWRSRAG